MEHRPKTIGVMGSSAGGHLAARVSTGFEIIGQTAKHILQAKTREWPGRALYHREGFGPMWQGPGKSALVIALQTALLDLTEEDGPCQVRLCPSIRMDREEDGKHRLCTPEEMQQRVTAIKEAGFSKPKIIKKKNLKRRIINAVFNTGNS